MLNSICTFMYLPLILVWWVFGLTLVFSPSLLCLALWIVTFGVIVEWAHKMEAAAARG